jgi:hypothetical protein
MRRMLYRYPLSLLLICGGAGITALQAQTFVRVTDASNAIVNDAGPIRYSGAAWVDYDNDGDLDLYVNNSALYRNDGGGAFVKVATAIGASQPMTTAIFGFGNTWADYDNDGDLDVFVCSLTSILHRNDGTGAFTEVREGALSDPTATPGWACAFADYDNDGYVDLSVTHPAGFVTPSPTPNHLFHNDGPPNYTFTRVIDGPIVMGLAAYTVGSWSDYDLDGDLDHFIGSGPANGTPVPDNLYRNRLKESGTATFERITDAPIATDLQDGQIWNWIDYDNDGDFDAYLTNWGGANTPPGTTNRLYRNDGGTFTAVTSGPLVTDIGVSLSSVWGDFDNDGDLDCYVTTDATTLPAFYYQNNGDGTFTSLQGIPPTNAQFRRGATAGDYDRDGDLDLLTVSPPVTGGHLHLYRNDLANGHHWLTIKPVGTVSNRAGIGARLRAKATIGGRVVWQMQEVSAQNTFNGHNALEVHVGLGDATTVDSLFIYWPSGKVDAWAGVAADQVVTLEEGSSPVAREEAELPATVELEQNYPNPFNPTTTIRYTLPAPLSVRLRVYDLLGRPVATLAEGLQGAGTHAVVFEAGALPSGLYLYRLEAGTHSEARRLVLLR